MSNARDAIKANIASEARHVAKTTRIDLAAFVALSDAERGQRWRQWSLSSKQDVVIQQITALGYDWDDASVAHFVAKYDERWENGQKESDLVIPPAALILDRASDDFKQAQLHGDAAGMAQINRVRMNITRGARLCWVMGDLLIGSINHPGTVYSVNRVGCSCPNGVAGKAACWHVCLFDLLLAMFETEVETADIDAEIGGGGPTAAEIARAQLSERLEATAAELDAMRAAQGRTALPAKDNQPSEQPRRMGWRLAQARKRSAYFASAFYLEAA